MDTPSQSWFSCCNSDAVQHDKWQDIDPKARRAAQREIEMITGKASTSTTNSNSHTERFNPQTYIPPSSNAKVPRKQTPRTPKSKVNSVEESIIHGRFDDLINSNSFVKPVHLTPQNTGVNGSPGFQNHKPQTVYPPHQPLYPNYQSFQPQPQQFHYPQAASTNLFIRR